jgi:chondroitin AC lyase
MRDIARAYNSPASSHYLSTTARDKYLLAFDGWVAANPDNTNWWWKDIGYPIWHLGEGMLLMRSQLSAAQITSGNNLLAYSYLPRSNVGLENTGANRTDRAYGTMMRAILSVNTSLLTESFLSIGDTIVFTTLEGMQPDGSYQQHEAQLYTGGYGKGFGTSIPKYGSYSAGTVYKYGPRQIREYTDWLLDGTQWMLRGPLIDHSVLGRGIVNNAQSAADFLYAAERTLPMAGDYRASELEAMRVRLEADLATKVADPALALSGNRMFWRSDYMTHHRADFMVSLRTASTRTIECEVINEQNKKGLHQSDGMLLINRRGDEYTGLMPVWDWQRLPGTTIEQASYSLRPRPEGATPDWLYGTSTHAGGVSDGTDGAISYIYSKRNVSARKSWFFVGDAMWRSVHRSMPQPLCRMCLRR